MKHIMELSLNAQLIWLITVEEIISNTISQVIQLVSNLYLS